MVLLFLFQLQSSLCVKSDEHGFIKEEELTLAKIATLCNGNNLPLNLLHQYLPIHLQSKLRSWVHFCPVGSN